MAERIMFDGDELTLLKLLEGNIGIYVNDIAMKSYILDIDAVGDTNKIFAVNVLNIPLKTAIAIAYKGKEILDIVKNYVRDVIIDGNDHTITFGGNFVIHGIDEDDLSIICSNGDEWVNYQSINKILEVPAVYNCFSMNKIAQQDNE